MAWDDLLRDAHASASSDEPRAWALLAPLIEAAERDPVAARHLVSALQWDALDRARRLAAAQAVAARWPDDVALWVRLGNATESLLDRRYLNAPPPEDPWFARLAARLLELFDGAPDDAARERAAEALASVARLCGRAWDEACERAHGFVVSRQPTRWQAHYDLGLFLKCRGRFAEGLAANREAARLGGADDPAVIWNLGICATGAGDGATALATWDKIGAVHQGLGPDGLPLGRYPAVQVRLAERPVAARDADQDDPGAEETIWIERLSPCHGVVQSALYADLGVDFGDVVLFDGAPIVTRRWGDVDVPVFPHLATLRREPRPIFRFAGTQAEPGQVRALGERLGLLFYVHTEQMQVLCRACWEKREGHDHEAGTPRPIVTGKLVLEPGASLEAAARTLSRELAVAEQPQVVVPGLWRALGDEARAADERDRYDLLTRAPVATA